MFIFLFRSPNVSCFHQMLKNKHFKKNALAMAFALAMVMALGKPMALPKALAMAIAMALAMAMAMIMVMTMAMAIYLFVLYVYVFGRCLLLGVDTCATFDHVVQNMGKSQFQKSPKEKRLHYLLRKSMFQ